MIAIEVISHAGFRGDEYPIAVLYEKQRFDVVKIEERWIAGGVDTRAEIIRGFVVRCHGGARFKLQTGETSGWRGELLPGPRLIQ